MRLAILVLSLLALGACTAGEGAGPQGPRIIATTSILADIVASLGVEVATLIPDGVDPHEFEPTARDIASLRQADLVLAFGLGLEVSLEKALDSAREAGVEVIEIGSLVEPLPMPGGGLDPHVWTDPIRMGQALGAIGENLSRIDQSRDWDPAIAAAVGGMARLDREIEELLDGVTNRRLVTDHLVLGYFANRYDFEVMGSLVPSSSSLGSPSSRDITELLEVIRSNSIPALFIQPGGPASLAETVASQAGFSVNVVEVRIESLGAADGPTSTYRGLMIELATRIARALE